MTGQNPIEPIISTFSRELNFKAMIECLHPSNVQPTLRFLALKFLRGRFSTTSYI